MPNHLTQWFFDIPVVTRLYLTTSFLLTVSVSVGYLSHLQLYLNYRLVYQKLQLWRLVTTFFYFGQFSFNWVFHMFFIGSYCRMLEEGSFQGRTADFCWMLILFAVSLLFAGPILRAPFLSSALTFTTVYVWSRRSPDVQMTFLGLFTFSAPYLPYVMVLFNLFINNSFPYSHVIAIGIGHLYYFLEDVWPHSPASNGRRLLETPQFVKRMFEPLVQAEPIPNHPHED